MYDVNSRIKDIRKALNLSQTEFGERLHVSRSVINNLERSANATEPNSLFLDNVAVTFDVNRVWLETGEGEMFVQKSRDDEISIWAASLQDVPDSFKYKFAHALSKLNDRDWEVIEKVVQLLYDEETKKDEGI